MAGRSLFNPDFYTLPVRFIFHFGNLACFPLAEGRNIGINGDIEREESYKTI